MRKIILLAVAGYLWKKFQANRAASPVAGTGGRPVGAARSPTRAEASDFS